MSKDVNRWNITELLRRYVVKIPEIQRDYAQGRDKGEVPQIRENLLKDIFDVLCGKVSNNLALNYIYGVPDKEELVLIDGQQRVTTLFLLKFYLAIRANENNRNFLSRLKYATRKSSKDFCEFLSNFDYVCEFPADKKIEIANKIKDDTGFKKKWLNDPTVVSMLNMLDAIDKKYSEVCAESDLCGCKEEDSSLNRIEFSFVPLDGFKRTEELYSAMNSRGKILTNFEILKGRVLGICQDSDLPGEINDKWVPAFWELAMKCYDEQKIDEQKIKNDNIENKEQCAAKYHDEYLYNYFSFVIYMLCIELFGNNLKSHKIQKLDVMEGMVKNVFDKSNSANCGVKVFNTIDGRVGFIKFAMDISKLFDVTSDPDYNEFMEWVYANVEAVETSGDTNNGGTQKRIERRNIFEECLMGVKAFGKDNNKDNKYKCYLWAFIKYKWDHRDIEGQVKSEITLKDYLTLTRSLFMSVATEDSPTRIRTSLEDIDVFKVIRRFNAITEGNPTEEDKKSSQYLVFVSTPKKYDMLNNKFVRGCTENIREVLLDEHRSPDECKMFSTNLKWILDTSKDESKGYWTIFKHLDACGLGQIRFDNSQTYEDRIFIPITKNILISLFSIDGWKDKNDFRKLIDIMCSQNLQDRPEKEYGLNDWEYYMCHESFRSVDEKDDFGQYITGEEGKMSFNAKRAIGARATKHQKWNPFEKEIYLRARELGKVKGCFGNKFTDFRDNYGLEFKYEGGKFKWICNLEAEPFECSGNRDIIDEFWEHIKPKLQAEISRS